MNSKEALDNLVGIQLLNYNELFLDEYQEEFDSINKDLERLEKLEQENQELREYFSKIASGNTIIELCRENEELKEKIRLTHTEFGFDTLSDFRKQMRENYIELVKLKKVIEIIIRCDIVPHSVIEKDYEGYIYLQNYYCFEDPRPTNEEYELLKEVLGNEKNS